MRKLRWFLIATPLVVAAGGAVAQDQGIQSIIGNVFLQNTTPGTAQVGHATITGTFRAGQVFVQQSGTAIPIVGNSLGANGSGVGGSFSTASPTGSAVRGTATASNQGSVGVGVRGDSRSDEGIGVKGTCFTSGGFGVVGLGNTGVFGQANGPNGGAAGSFQSTVPGSVGVNVVANSGAIGLSVIQGSSSSATGIISLLSSATNNGFSGDFRKSGTGVCLQALNLSTTGITWGIWGESKSTGGSTGVIGTAPNTGANIGVEGHCSSATGFGVFSTGRTGATGTKSFVIDHPLDPENKYLLHFSSESPEPMNFYTGLVRTDARGYATVTLPDYYSSINGDSRIQLTVVDESDSAGFAMAKVVRKIHGNSFMLRTSTGRVEVYWRVEAVRNDRWVQKYGHESEPTKPQAYRGTYLEPDLYGKPVSLAQISVGRTENRPPRSGP